MSAKRMRKWDINIDTSPYETETVKLHSFGTIQVITPRELERIEHTLVGIIFTVRRRVTGSKSAVACVDGVPKADILERVPCSRECGYLATTKPGYYVEIRRPAPVRYVVTILLLLIMATMLMCIVHPRATATMMSLVAGTVGSGVENIENIGVTPQKIKARMPDPVLPQWETIVIPASKRNVEIDLFNPLENEDCYYLAFKLMLIGDGYNELICETGLIEPGEHITDVTLNRALEPGRYDAYVYVQPFTMSQYPEMTESKTVYVKLVAH